MLLVMQGSWALLLGMLFLQLGNGLQGTLLGVRGELENFSTFEMSVVMSAYFVGFLGASRLVPRLIRRVGHVRVFAALASFISAILILYPLLVNPWIWTAGRVIIGFCFCGVYITAESWLNNAATNENRGQLLSSYMVVQMAGIVAAQLLLLAGDPGGFELFVLISVLVSISFAPILLSITPTPAFEATKPMSIRELFSTSPLGCVGMFFLGGIFSAQFGMAPVFGTQAGLSLSEIFNFCCCILYWSNGLSISNWLALRSNGSKNIDCCNIRNWVHCSFVCSRSCRCFFNYSGKCISYWRYVQSPVLTADSIYK